MPLLKILSSSFGDEIRLQVSIHFRPQIDKPLPPFIAETSMSDLELNTYNLQRPNYTVNMFCFHDHKASELPSQSFELTVCGFYSILSFSLRLLAMLETVLLNTFSCLWLNLFCAREQHQFNQSCVIFMKWVENTAHTVEHSIEFQQVCRNQSNKIASSKIEFEFLSDLLRDRFTSTTSLYTVKLYSVQDHVGISTNSVFTA